MEGRPVMMRRAPRMPNAGSMTVASRVSLRGELAAVGETEVMTAETTVVAVNMVLVGTLITSVPEWLVLIVDTGTEVVNVVVIVEFWAWTRSGNNPRTTLSTCRCRAAIVNDDDERRESGWGSGRVQDRNINSAFGGCSRPERACTEQITTRMLRTQSC
jgi:hypothetical protein